MRCDFPAKSIVSAILTRNRIPPYHSDLIIRPPNPRQFRWRKNERCHVRAIIVPPPPIHSPPRHSFEVMQTQDLLDIRLDVLLSLRLVAPARHPLRDVDGRRWRCGRHGLGFGEGVGD